MAAVYRLATHSPCLLPARFEAGGVTCAGTLIRWHRSRSPHGRIHRVSLPACSARRAHRDRAKTSRRTAARCARCGRLATALDQGRHSYHERRRGQRHRRWRSHHRVNLTRKMSGSDLLLQLLRMAERCAGQDEEEEEEAEAGGGEGRGRGEERERGEGRRRAARSL